jgi:DNA-binding NtrC family response regulator
VQRFARCVGRRLQTLDITGLEVLAGRLLQTPDMKASSSIPTESAPRILIADSDVSAAMLLRQRLRSMHPKWLVSCVDGAAAAIELVDRASIDVLITELELGDLRGERLLRAVASRYPETVCIVHATRAESALGLSRLSHRVLAKPAPDAALFPAVLSALRLRQERARCTPAPNTPNRFTGRA